MAKTKQRRGASPSLATSRIEQYYNKIVIGFVVLTVLLVGLIAYFSFSKTTITVTAAELPQEVTIETTLDELGGTLLFTDIEATATAENLESTASTAGTAGGTVTIVNNYNQDQPLVSTTRLLSDEGVLFRTQETVTVPAGGSVEVAVLADEEGEAGDIGPSEFEIVALWDGLKDRIYATSDTAMTGGLVETVVVSEADVTALKKELNQNIRTQAVARFEEESKALTSLPTNPRLLEGTTITAVLNDEISGEAGATVEGELTASRTATVAGAVVDSEKLQAAVDAELDAALAEYTVLASAVADSDMTLELGDIAEIQADTPVTVTVTATAKITDGHEQLDTTALRNRSAQEVETYLEAFDEVDAVRVDFSPFWVSRTPSLADNIEIVVE